MVNYFEEKQRFLLYTFAVETIKSSLGTRNPKAPIYKKGVTEKLRTEFKNQLIYDLMHFMDWGLYTDKESMLNGMRFIQGKYSEYYGEILHNNTFRFGIAQKVITLFTKYLWMMDLFPSPPEIIPYDGIIKDFIGSSFLPNWTEIETEEEYIEYVLPELHLGSSEPAVEELAQWNKKVIPGIEPDERVYLEEES